MKLRKVLSVVLAALMIVALAACSKDSTSTDSGGEASGESTENTGAGGDQTEFDVVYLSPSTESEYWQYGEIGMRNAIADLEEKEGIKINFSVSGPASESETDAYIKAYESVIASGPDAIITATLAPDGTVPKTQEAQNAGIYVNFVSMGLEGGDSNEYDDLYGVHYYCDNMTIGETAAQCMLDGLEAKGVEPKGKIGMHMSVVVETLEERMNGFKAYMAEHAPEIECLDTLYNENDVNNAQANVETQISTYGDELIGLYGGNNISGDGIALGLKNAGNSDILGIGVDSDSLEIEALEAGNLYAIVVQTPYEQGYKAMENAITYLRTGENTESEKHINCPSTAITKEIMDTEESKALLDPTILKK